MTKIILLLNKLCLGNISAKWIILSRSAAALSKLVKILKGKKSNVTNILIHLVKFLNKEHIFNNKINAVRSSPP